MSETIEGKYIEGDAAVGKNVTTGGDATVRGRMQVDHDLKIGGTADISNLKRLILQGHDITSIITSIFDGDIDIDDNSLLTSAAILKLIDKEISKLADWYLRKDKKDTAAEEITFKDGFVLGAATFKKAILSGALESEYSNDSLISSKAVLDLIKKYLEGIVDKYIRKDIDDEAKGLITFLKGLKAEGIATFLAGMAVEGLATFSGTLSSPNFWSGWTGEGWRLWFRDTVNIVGGVVPKASLELDDLTVRGTFRVFEFVINQLRGENDNYVFSGMMKVERIDTDEKKIYLDTNKGETYNPFRKDDILRCKRWKFGDNIAKQYDVLVKEAYVGDVSDGEDRVDWIEYEKIEIDAGEVEQGDVLCRLDNLTDPDRKGIITTTSIGDGAPYIDVLYGMMTRPKESLKVRLGRLDGVINEMLGALSGYGLYSNNAYLTGEFFLWTGEAVATKIKMLENQFSSSMSKTTYDIKEDDNIVTNCAFIDDMKGWTTVDGDDMDLFFIDDTPVFMNDDMFSDGRSVATIENMQGKDMLHLLNAGVTQDNVLFVNRMPADSEVEEYVKDSNGNIVKNEDGTLKTETKTIRPTIYISYRYMCKESGSLSIGFNNGRTTQYSSDMGVIVSVDELGTLTESVNANEGVWIERQYKGYYDKSGDFVISTTGEVYIDVLAVTSKPLNDFKNVVSTALVQTAGAIGLYGRNIKAAYDNIGGLTTSITELGVRVDAEKERVDIFVNKTYPAKMTEIDNRLTVNEEGISLTAKTVEANVTRIGQLEVTSGKISAYVAKTRTAGAELVYNNTVTIRTDENNKTATILDYIITPTFLIANVEQTITNIQIASGSDTGNPHLVVMTEPFAVKVVCDKGVAFTEPVLLEAVVTVTRTEDDVYGEAKEQTYQRSMFITVYPSTKGETGYRGAFKSTVFKRSLDKPSKPVGGSYDSPVPEGWSDGIPALVKGEANYQIWASTKVMYDYASTSDWSDPVQLTDTADFDVEYSSVENPTPPTGHPNTNTQWSNNADENTEWMATSVCKNGVWTDWEVIKTKGEKGDPGRGVTSVNTFYALHTSLSSTPSDGAFTYDALSDVVISSNADMYVWSADKVTYSEGDPEFTGKYCIGKCSDLTSVSEQYGTSSSTTSEPTTWSDTYPQDIQSGSYIWTRDKITWKDGSVTYSTAQLSGQIPVGISSIVNTYNVTATSTTAPTEWKTNSPAVTDENPFLWRKMVITYTNGTTKTDISLIGAKGSKGVDGTSVEYIYKLSTTESVPATPSTSQDDDYVPTGWSDDPQGVTSTNKFEYVSSRTKSNGVWSAFSTPSLWAKYSEDGEQGATGYGFVATVDRNNKFTEVQWNGTYGTTGHTETWSDTSAIRNGCRVGDIFLVTGYATDTLNMHSAFYRSTTASGNLTGTCISHSVVARGQKGDTGAGEVWQLIDNGCYASVTAEEKLTLYLAYVVVYTIDGTSVSNDNYTVYWKANNKTDWHYASNGVMLNAVDFNKDATYKETESFVVRLESNGVAVGTITVPVKLAPGAAQIITDNMIKTNVFGSGEWSSVKQTANAVSTEVANARGDSASLSIALDGIKSSVKGVDGRLTTIEQTVDGINLSVYAKTEYVDGETGAIKTKLNKSGIDIEANKITIGSTGGKLVVDTTNFKLDEAGNVTVTGTINATSGTIGRINISESGISAGNYEEGFFVLESSGTLWASNVNLSGHIAATSGTFDNCTINESCVIKGKLQGAYGQFGAWELGKYKEDLYCQKDFDVLFVMQNTKHNKERVVTIRTTNGMSTYYGDSSTDSVPMLSVQTDNGVCADFTVAYTGGTALSLSAPSGATAMSCRGDVVLSGLVRGLRLNATTMSSGGTISSSYDVICFNNTSAITVTLPSASTYKGRMLFLKKLGSGSVTLKGTIIPANGTGSTTTTESVGANKSMIYISNGSAWIEYYCG